MDAVFSPGHGPLAKHVNDTTNLLQNMLKVNPTLEKRICIHRNKKQHTYPQSFPPPPQKTTNLHNKQSKKQLPKSNKSCSKPKNKKQGNQTKQLQPTHGAKKTKKTHKTTQTPGAPLEVVSRRATRKVVRLRSNAQRAPGVKVTGTRSRT